MGANGGTPGNYGALDRPYEVVSSEFLQMEGRKFSSSRNVVIYVGDMLSRYDPDALRYYLAVAGPENQDTDFTWAEFVRRNNDELVAGWGNLVNRTIVDDGEEPRGYPGRGRSSPMPITRCWPRHGRRSTPSADCSPGPGRGPQSARPCGWSARRTSTCRTRRPGS